MPAIAFHFNAPDKLAYACRLLRKAASQGAQVVVTAPSEALRQLDGLLWTFSALDFVAHAKASDPPHVRNASSVVLTEAIADAPHRQVLLNLGEEVPDGFEQFERLIEVVALDDADRLLARSRWKHYSQLGHVITRHDLNLKGAL
jgi:DNA polymerase-3 subunit chi